MPCIRLNSVIRVKDCRALKVWGKVAEAKLKRKVKIKNLVLCQGEAPNHFQNIDGKAQKRSKGVLLSVCRLGEGLWQGAKRGFVVFYKKIMSGREV